VVDEDISRLDWGIVEDPWIQIKDKVRVLSFGDDRHHILIRNEMA
jgi:hypothetical protein